MLGRSQHYVGLSAPDRLRYSSILTCADSTQVSCEVKCLACVPRSSQSSAPMLTFTFFTIATIEKVSTLGCYCSPYQPLSRLYHDTSLPCTGTNSNEEDAGHLMNTLYTLYSHRQTLRIAPHSSHGHTKSGSDGLAGRTEN